MAHLRLFGTIHSDKNLSDEVLSAELQELVRNYNNAKGLNFTKTDPAAQLEIYSCRAATGYIVIVERTITDLVAAVNKAIDGGYMPHGNMVIESVGDVLYFQPMIRL